MIEKLEELLYNVLYFIFNSKLGYAIFYISLSLFIVYFILLRIHKTLAIGYIGGATITLIYKLTKKDNHD